MVDTAAGIPRDEMAARYLELLPFEPYPIQQEALLAWFTSEQGVLVCAPTGTGKTLIAEAALYEALQNNSVAYYTTPLIALTEQKFQELQQRVVEWGFEESVVGLVTGNRRVNPQARILVVVAEILFNRLLHPEAFPFDRVTAVVMDEFHSFNDPERGIVWELTLGMLPAHVRLLLLSATVGNAYEFVRWIENSHHRRLELVEGRERKVPLTYLWIGDMLLTEFIEQMAAGDEAARKTPALVFCFNRDECWNVAEQLRGKRLISSEQQQRLAAELERFDWSEGAGAKLKQLLMRGVGVHHAGILPKYKRVVEELFQQKLLAVTVCTETLSAGINLPARSVVLPTLMKGKPGDKKVLDASSAHQIFGRAGRPQFDTEGFVFALAHEDDVKILRWREKFDKIPEDTKDPQLLRAKKDLKRKMPTRRSTEQYWNASHFEKLRSAPSAKLYSRGLLPWRLLAYLLEASPEIEPIRQLVGKRLMDSKRLARAQDDLDHMLRILWTAGYVRLEPEPPPPEPEPEPAPAPRLPPGPGVAEEPPPKPRYRPLRAVPTPELRKLLWLRSVNPLYGAFLVNQLGIADRNERIQAMESVLEIPSSVAPYVRVPAYEDFPPGPLATTRLDSQLLRLGLAAAEELAPPEESEADVDRRFQMFADERPRILTLAEKLRRLFDHDFPGVHDVHTQPVWAAGELLEFGGNFNRFITGKQLQKQEGILFRHFLRLILLIAEFAQFCPPETTAEEWGEELDQLSRMLVDACRRVDPASTEQTIEQTQAIVELP